jgi:transcriptional regulator with GAF, ATPase, and Fis domain
MDQSEGRLGPSDLFPRVAAVVRRFVPFERMGVSLLEGDQVRVFAMLVELDGFGASDERAEPLFQNVRPRTAYSPRLWPESVARPAVIRDSFSELDPSFETDRVIQEMGVRSLLELRLDVEGRELGTLWFDAREANRFTEDHASAIAPLAELMALALEHDRLWVESENVQRRREALGKLLPMFAESLDVRELLLSLSSTIQETLPHDTLSFSLLTPDRGGVVVQAANNDQFRRGFEYRFSHELEVVDSNWKHFVTYEVDYFDPQDEAIRVRVSPPGAPEPRWIELRPGPGWVKIFRTAGLNSTIRVPIRARDRPLGGVAFSSRRKDLYGDLDVAIAQRIADHVALGLAHQELAEQAQRSALAAERAAQLEERVGTLSRELERYSAHRALGESRSWREVLAQATKVAATDTTVLLLGESGTGKEVVARYLHRGSKRSGGPFVALNCAALPEQLLESELFGHERGAFTGALQSHSGKIEQAQGGVLFLDEIGEMSPALQAKLLRFLQEREYQRLGSAKTWKADVRILAATNRDPKKAMEEGRFREDLYYRLSVFEIVLPPLRDRPEDIALLARAFLEEIGHAVGRPAAGISQDAVDLLLAHRWPGNVRELRNAIERAVILCEGGLATSEHLPITVAGSPASRARVAADGTFPVDGLKLEAVERDLLKKALVQAKDNKSEAARLLGLTRGQFYSLLRKHQLSDVKR